ncbi:MAG: hypothetical protein NTX59_04645 [Elusimicrobia bacterium]|nr:hypothetical protein [Elusimicrobiota bacterium]
MTKPLIENIADGAEPIALIVRAGRGKPGIQFFTPPNYSQQLARMRHPAGRKIAAHTHRTDLAERFHAPQFYTHEVLLIREGRARVELYTSGRKLLCRRILSAGDVIMLCGGGHALEMLEETSIIEIKQGPYSGDGDKIHFKQPGKNK